jgi:hypothetical protein
MTGIRYAKQGPDAPLGEQEPCQPESGRSMAGFNKLGEAAGATRLAICESRRILQSPGPLPVRGEDGAQRRVRGLARDLPRPARAPGDQPVNVENDDRAQDDDGQGVEHDLDQIVMLVEQVAGAHQGDVPEQGAQGRGAEE